MPDRKGSSGPIRRIPLQIIGFLMLAVLAVLLLWTGAAGSGRSVPASYPKVRFHGEYRIGDGQWRQVVEGQHIPATQGDVTLRGTFHMIGSDGEYIGPVGEGIPIAFYSDHIGITIREDGQEPYVMDNENPLLGPDACGRTWAAYVSGKDSTEPIEIVIHDPHRFGNETAVDALLSKLSTWPGTGFERDVLASGSFQRITGSIFLIVSFILLGTALFSSLLHIDNCRVIWLLGLTILSAGGYFLFSSEGVFFWNQTVISNTTMLGISMMSYMLFLSVTITYSLEKTKRIGTVTDLALGVADGVSLLIPMVCDISFYDMWEMWVIIQTVANTVLLGCTVREWMSVSGARRWICAGTALLLIAFEADSVATALGIWQGGRISMTVFVVLFVVALVTVLQIIPRNVDTVIRARTLEAEKKALDAQLAESRISTMISQIRPHFVYNTLGSIEQLCEVDPGKAAELVHNFARYLRGNFGELDNPRPIRMSQEMEHVRHYISIENVRFPDMVFTFEMGSGDFKIPALTIQPIIENAIKHGLMKLQKGGSIQVRSFETDTHYHVCVEDDGVGFDTGILLDERKHIGLRNIRGRLEAMVGGTLEIESTVGVGTKVTIKIPKEVGE